MIPFIIKLSIAGVSETDECIDISFHDQNNETFYELSVALKPTDLRLREEILAKRKWRNGR
jgi:hypothetical protein